MRRVLVIALCLLMAAALTACAAPAETADGTVSAQTGGSADAASAGTTAKPYKIAFAFYNLSNPIWAEQVEYAQEYAPTVGAEVVFVDSGEDAAQQKTDVENFIQSGVDAICLIAVDPASIIPTVLEAKAAGIKVIDESRGIKECDVTLTLDPDENGKAEAAAAAAWINAHYSPDETVEWVFLDIPTVEVGVLEGDAVRKYMKEYCPNAVEVGNAATLSLEQGVTNTENLLQAHPNCRVVLSLGGAGAVGANQVIKSMITPAEYDDWCVIGIDGTQEEVLAIMSGEVQKATISMDGSYLDDPAHPLGLGRWIGKALVDTAIQLIKGEYTGEWASYFPTVTIDATNAETYYNSAWAVKP